MDLSPSYDTDLVGHNCQYLTEYDGMFESENVTFPLGSWEWMPENYNPSGNV